MIFGIGAAGNKAAVNLIEKGIVSKEYVRLLNTTPKDIPDNYKNDKCFVQISSALGGCGKEPNKGKAAMIEAIKNKTVDLGSMIPTFTKEVILITSTEGGTGCGATPIVAKYFNAMNIPVHIFAFIGFQDEARGMNNTLKFFRELNDNIILHTIVNPEFLYFTGNYAKAEQSANDYLAEQIRILLFSKLIVSSQNIDDTDQYKISTTPGYMFTEHISLDGVKNVEMFNQTMSDALDNNKCLDYNRGCKRLAIIINASNKVKDAIDDKMEVIKRYVGEPFETFRHIQDDEQSGDWIDIIASGMSFPEKGIIDLSKKYNSVRDKLNKDVKSFDDIFADIDISDDEDEFNMNLREITNADIDNLFSDTKPKKKKEKATIIIDDDITSNY